MSIVESSRMADGFIPPSGSLNPVAGEPTQQLPVIDHPPSYHVIITAPNSYFGTELTRTDWRTAKNPDGTYLHEPPPLRARTAECWGPAEVVAAFLRAYAEHLDPRSRVTFRDVRRALAEDGPS